MGPVSAVQSMHQYSDFPLVRLVFTTLCYTTSFVETVLCGRLTEWAFHKCAFGHLRKRALTHQPLAPNPSCCHPFGGRQAKQAVGMVENSIQFHILMIIFRRYIVSYPFENIAKYYFSSVWMSWNIQELCRSLAIWWLLEHPNNPHN